MTEQKRTDVSTRGTVTISYDDELRLNRDIYRPHFADREYVRPGTHPDFDLIFVQPVTGSGNETSEIRDSAYKIDHTQYTGEISCRTFLQRHNYHHTRTTQYVAEWWTDHEVLCVDLTDPADSEGS